MKVTPLLFLLNNAAPPEKLSVGFGRKSVISFMSANYDTGARLFHPIFQLGQDESSLSVIPDMVTRQVPNVLSKHFVEEFPTVFDPEFLDEESLVYWREGFDFRDPSFRGPTSGLVSAHISFRLFAPMFCFVIIVLLICLPS